MGDSMGLIERYKDEIQLEDLPEVYQSLAKSFGGDIEKALRIGHLFGGGYTYCPQLKRSLKKCRDRVIREEFNGFNYKELAQRYNLSEARIRQIVNG